MGMVLPLGLPYLVSSNLVHHCTSIFHSLLVWFTLVLPIPYSLLIWFTLVLPIFHSLLVWFTLVLPIPFFSTIKISIFLFYIDLCLNDPVTLAQIKQFINHSIIIEFNKITILWQCHHCLKGTQAIFNQCIHMQILFQHTFPKSCFHTIR